MIEIFADGCSLGNPGPAGIGVVVYKDKKILKEVSLYIGEATNNFAEYSAFIFALAESLRLKPERVHIYMDSELVIRQVEGRYKIKNKNIYSLAVLAKNLVLLTEGCKFSHRDREENQLADSLAKQAARSCPKSKGNKKPVLGFQKNKQIEIF